MNVGAEKCGEMPTRVGQFTLGWLKCDGVQFWQNKLFAVTDMTLCRRYVRDTVADHFLWRDLRDR
jgi:hypothetical protein